MLSSTKRRRSTSRSDAGGITERGWSTLGRTAARQPLERASPVCPLGPRVGRCRVRREERVQPERGRRNDVDGGEEEEQRRDGEAHQRQRERSADGPSDGARRLRGREGLRGRRRGAPGALRRRGEGGEARPRVRQGLEVPGAQLRAPRTMPPAAPACARPRRRPRHAAARPRPGAGAARGGPAAPCRGAPPRVFAVELPRRRWGHEQRVAQLPRVGHAVRGRRGEGAQDGGLERRRHGTCALGFSMRGARTRSRSSTSLGARKRRRLVSISQSTTPSAYTSVRRSTRCAEACSGAM